MMDSNGNFARPFDESLIRELPQLQSLRIAPLRQPGPSRILSIPSPLEPNASGVRDSTSISAKASTGIGGPPRNTESTSGVPEPPNPGRTKKNDPSVDTLLSLEPPPKPILPSFVNLRALERFPYSSFDDDSSHARKRRRVDVQADSFGEHLQLPIPQSQKEPRPPPFGPFAILNGLNEPPPNAALLPPIEAGNITQLLTKPSRDQSYVEPALLTANTAADTPSGEKREGRIEEILDPPVSEKPVQSNQQDVPSSAAEGPEVDATEPPSEAEADKEHETPANETSEPLSPKSRGRSRKNLRKWTEEETTALLRGVVKCGIGNWTAILAQPELKFNKRSASNLKDRYDMGFPNCLLRPSDTDNLPGFASAVRGRIGLPTPTRRLRNYAIALLTLCCAPRPKEQGTFPGRSASRIRGQPASGLPPLEAARQLAWKIPRRPIPPP